MKFKHIVLDTMERAYAAATFNINQEPAIFIASEEKGHPCYMYTGENFENKTVVWEKGGGCMSIVPIPNKENQFLAIVDFYLKESPSHAKLVWGKYQNEIWIIKEVLSLPYLHRFDIYTVNGVNYFVGATIADKKAFKDDWSSPGSIYRSVIPENPSDGFELEMIKTDMFRNHGYYRYETDDTVRGYFASDEGVFMLEPENDWQFTQILEGPIGEIAVMDINGDGHEEIMTIEPFHGDTIKIYENHDNKYTESYRLPLELNFGHALVATKFSNIPTFVGGIRRVGNQLFTVQYLEGKYTMDIIDDGGPSNVAIGHCDGKDYIVSANHTRNEAAVYIRQ